MTNRRLRTAGWLAMTSALLAIPWLLLSFKLIGMVEWQAKVAEISVMLLGTALFVYLLLTFRRMLHERYGFRETDRFIDWLVKTNIVSVAVACAGLLIPAIEEGVAVFGFLMIALIGILQVLFGFRLLRLDDSLKGLHRPYCYLNIVTGCFTAVIILLPLGVITSAVGDVMLGTIFFHAASGEDELGA